jgi:hypothetical protein
MKAWCVVSGLICLVVGAAVPAAADLPVGLRLDGAAAGDNFGYCVAGAGDVDGDGVPDIIVGAPYADPGGRTNAGSVFVLSGADGAQLFRFDGGTAGDYLGYSVASAGDVNGDGTPDIIAGAPYATFIGWIERGYAIVWSGATGSQLRRFDGSDGGWRLGWSVAGVGDVNSDGRDDLIVGAPYASVTGSQSGRALVFSGASGGELHHYDASGAYNWLGYSVAGAGDVNGDGVPDLIVGSLGNYALIFSGADWSQLKVFAAGYGTGFGYCVRGAGDVNGDGTPDVIVGAPTSSPGGRSEAGSAFVYSGADWAQLFQFDGLVAGDKLGYSVASAGDVNDDGVPDIIVGAPLADPNGLSEAGNAFVFSGANGDVIRILDGPAAGDRLGSSVAGVGDVNGDGLDDVIVAAPNTDPAAGTDAGSAWLLTPVGPSMVINPPPIPLGAPATSSLSVNLLLPVVGASTVEFKEQGQSVWTSPVPYAPTSDWTFSAGQGTRRLWARYRDASDVIMADVFDDILVDQAPPTVAVTAPAPGAVVKGVVAVTATASDTGGIASVMFKVDGALKATDTTAPYGWNWDTVPQTVAEGAHSLTARAIDRAGNANEATITVTVDNTTFNDVPKTHRFWLYIEALNTAGVTSGCNPSPPPPLYCPDLPVTRAQMAKFLCKAAGKTELDATTPAFTDVAKGSLFYGWIERLANAASWGGAAPTSGCTATTYCPNQNVTRDQMAKFLCKATGKIWFAKGTPTFSDVPTGNFFYGWIERLADTASWGGIAPTSGCTLTTYCPGAIVTRGQMAKFLVIAFGLAT